MADGYMSISPTALDALVAQARGKKAFACTHYSTYTIYINNTIDTQNTTDTIDTINTG